MKCWADFIQTPLSFSSTDDATYDDVASKSVWVCAASLRLDKRQCTVQLALFADGVSRIMLLVIFKGKSKRIL